MLGQCSWLISRPGLSDYFSKNEARLTISVALESQEVDVDTATNNYEMCKFPLSTMCNIKEGSLSRGLDIQPGYEYNCMCRVYMAWGCRGVHKAGVCVWPRDVDA